MMKRGNNGFILIRFKKSPIQKTKGELVNEISTLCQKFPQVKDYYQARSRDPKDVLNKHKTIIEKEFIEGKTRGLPKARLSVGKKAISDFRKLSKDPELITDLMLTFVESVSWFSAEFGPDRETFYTSPEKMFEKALKFAEKKGFLGYSAICS